MFSNYLTISYYTFNEIYKSRIMINVLILGFIIGLLSLVAGEFTYGVPGRVSLDIGLGLKSLSLICISIFMGATLVSREIEQRTIYMTLSRPVSRSVFILSRISGMAGILILNSLLLSLITAVVAVLSGGAINTVFVWSVLFIVLEAVTLLLIVVIFSLLANTVLSVIFTVTVYVTSHVIVETIEFVSTIGNMALAKILNFFTYVLPAFSKMNIKSFVVYESTLPMKYLFAVGAQSIAYIAFLLVLLNLIFKNKSLD
jgi:ABC-type transport system involved in multi-copper enzyme maturation permease subunit